MGEFGAVSVLSEHLCGKTSALPLYVELFYQGYDFIELSPPRVFSRVRRSDPDSKGVVGEKRR